MSTRVQTPTNELINSLDFYKKLGFTLIQDENPCLLTDGKIIVEINPDRYARAGIKLFRSDWSDQIQQLKKITTVNQVGSGYLLSDPSGTWIYLLENETQTPLKKDISPSILGKYAGISLESTAIEASIPIWEILGFSKTLGGLEQGWVAVTNSEGFTVSIMRAFACPHLFFSPSFTYFNGQENLAIIAKVRALNIPITEEITHFNEKGIVDNIIIRDPGGFGFFVFSD